MPAPAFCSGRSQVVLLLSLAGAATANTMAQANPTTDQAARLQANEATYPDIRVLVGVDLLGRFAVAIDSDRDGVVDKSYLMTTAEKLTGPWSLRIESARVVSTVGTLRIEARDYSFAAALSVDGAPLPKVRGKDHGLQDFMQTLVNDKGEELLWVDGSGPALDSLRHDVLESWPEAFRQDR
jgi:hypothetical protein